MKRQYFEGNFPELTLRLEEHFGRVKSSWEESGFNGGLVLGGGYGRGEGGVMRTLDGPGFSNDLDYFFFHPNPSDPRLVGWAKQIERVESDRLGIDVEIKCLTADSIGDPSGSMMFSDLVAGHVVVAGDAGFLDELLPKLDFSRIGADEATRLLWNRGSGLFFAGSRMGNNAEKAFVIRNHAKMKLALGDSWLCLNGMYSPKCRERGVRLREVELGVGLELLKQWHEEGVSFKFNPISDGMDWVELGNERSQLIDAWGKVYLMAEERRLSESIPDFGTYLKRGRLLPESGVIRNLALSCRDRLKRGAFLRPLGDYPRASLMRALPCLLGRTPGGVDEAARFLPVKDDSDFESSYLKWWTYYA